MHPITSPLHRPVFRFLGFEYAEDLGELALHYAQDGFEHFTETFSLHDAPPLKSDAQRTAFMLACRQLHLAAGVSYYKACLAEKIMIDGAPISAATANFFAHFYTEGLGEFAYVNGLDLRGSIHFPHTDVLDKPASFSLPRRTMVPIGGGKDSIVALEALRAAKEPMILFGMGMAPPILETIRVAALPAIRVTRKISPALLSLNQQGAFNGHVPITGILSFLVPILGILYGADAAAFANERSANVGNLVRDGQEINHQWSKSLAFELAAAEQLRRCVLSHFHLYSLCRPLSELAIAKRFAQLPQYFSTFNSCNRNFSLSRPLASARWCRECPKCQFVSLILAPFIPRAQLEAFFGGMVLGNPQLRGGYRAILGLEGFKPFECVGEITEAVVALRVVAGLSDWQDCAEVQALAREVGGLLPQNAAQFLALLQPSAADNLPAHLQGIFT